MADNDEVGASDPNEVFILDMRRTDGTRFVTSASTAGGVARAQMRHGGVTAEVAHWKRDGAPFRCLTDDLMGVSAPDWRLAERFDL